MRAFLIFALIALSACTDATWDKYSVLGKSAEVKCYSGGKLIFHALSTGKVENEANSDGYFARWEMIFLEGEWRHVPTDADGHLSHKRLKTFAAGVGGDCIIIYGRK